MIGESVSTALATGLVTTGAVAAAVFTETCGSVGEAEVSGSVALTLAVVGAATTGATWDVLATAAGAVGAVGGGAAEALAPPGPVLADELELVAGLLTWTVVGDVTFGVLAVDVDAEVPVVLTAVVLGALIWGDCDALLATDGAGGTWAAAGIANAADRATVNVTEPTTRPKNDCCMHDLRGGRFWSTEALGAGGHTRS